MDIERLQDLSPEERHDVLEGECFSVEHQGYMKPLSPQEVTEYRELFAQKSIEIKTINEELSCVKESFKKRLEPLIKLNSTALDAIKNRSIWTEGKVYLMPDHENKVMHIVTAESLVLNTRHMKPEERQYTIRAAKTA